MPKPPDIIGLIYKEGMAEAQSMALALVERFNLENRAWIRSTADIHPDLPDTKNTDLIITVGGDGTIIRATSLSVPLGIPILGINLGRLGFMTELQADEALDKMPQYLDGAGWVEERSMLQVNTIPGKSQDGLTPVPAGEGSGYHALNDSVVGRGSVASLVMISAFIDGVLLTDFRADAVIVSTATGSTGYNLAVGGPILSPWASEIILKAVAPHVGMAPALVLPSSSVIEFIVEAEHEIMLSVDGYLGRELAPGEGVKVQRSPHKACFLRAAPPTNYYETLTRRLGFGGGQSTIRAIQY